MCCVSGGGDDSCLKIEPLAVPLFHDCKLFSSIDVWTMSDGHHTGNKRNTKGQR